MHAHVPCAHAVSFPFRPPVSKAHCVILLLLRSLCCHNNAVRRALYACASSSSTVPFGIRCATNCSRREAERRMAMEMQAARAEQNAEEERRRREAEERIVNARRAKQEALAWEAKQAKDERARQATEVKARFKYSEEVLALCHRISHPSGLSGCPGATARLSRSFPNL